MNIEEIKRLVREYLNESILNVNCWLNTCEHFQLIPKPEERGFVESLMYELTHCGSDYSWEESLDLYWSLMGNCIPGGILDKIVYGNLVATQRYYSPWCLKDDQLCIVNPSIAIFGDYVPLDVIIERNNLIADPTYCKDRKPEVYDKRCPIHWFWDNILRSKGEKTCVE